MTIHSPKYLKKLANRQRTHGVLLERQAKKARIAHSLPHELSLTGPACDQFAPRPPQSRFPTYAELAAVSALGFCRIVIIERDGTETPVPPRTTPIRKPLAKIPTNDLH